MVYAEHKEQLRPSNANQGWKNKNPQPEDKRYNNTNEAGH